MADQNPLLTGAPTWADAYSYNANALSNWVGQQRQISADRGLWNDQTGVPTAAGVVNAAGQYANALMMGTTGPEGRGTPTLKDWYGKSVYVDAHGQPELMYHGTDATFDTPRTNLTPDDHVPGISVTPNVGEAARYGAPQPVYIKAEKPMDYRQLDDWAAERAGKTGDPDFSAFDVPPDQLLKWLKQEGYDAIDYTSDPMLGYGIRVFDPSQIRRR